MQDLKDAEIKVIAGPEKKSRVIPQHERELTAYHEAGHAVVMHACQIRTRWPRSPSCPGARRAA